MSMKCTLTFSNILHEILYCYAINTYTLDTFYTILFRISDDMTHSSSRLHNYVVYFVLLVLQGGYILEKRIMMHSYIKQFVIIIIIFFIYKNVYLIMKHMQRTKHV